MTAAAARATSARGRTRIIPSRARPASLRAGQRAGADYGATAQPDWREVEFTRATVSVEGGTVSVVSLGEGPEPPALFIHGLGGSWKNWLENLPAAARSRRVYAIDLPGFGESPMPEGAVTIAGYAAVVEKVRAALGLGEVDVIGNSMGGFVAAELAIAHPDRVHKLVLVDAAGITIADLRRWPARTLMRLVVAQAGWGAAQRQILLRPGLRHLAFRTIMRHPTRLKLDLVAHQAGGPGMPGFLLAMDALLSHDFRDRLGEIRCPTLVIHGEQDMLVPVQDAWEFRRLIPGSRLLILQDTGHVPMLERAPTFNDVVAEFLADR